MLDPVGAMGVGIAELDGIGGLNSFGYQSLVELRFPFLIPVPLHLPFLL